MTDFLRDSKALVTPANDSDPYSVTPAPAPPVTVTPVPAGRELDALVAEKIFGWPGFTSVPYSTEIAAAWLVVEHLQKAHDLSFALGLNAAANGHQNGAKFFKSYQGLGHDIFDNAEHEGWYAVDETVPLAICKAALAARAALAADHD